MIGERVYESSTLLPGVIHEETDPTETCAIAEKVFVGRT
jgi:hypothetical protein